MGYQNGSTNASYTYNVNRFRKSKEVNGNTTGFVWNGSNLVGETNGANIVNTYNYGIDGILRCDMNGNKSYYLKNAHGDVVGATGTDGNITKTYTYDAFGNEQNKDTNDTNPFRYCGEYYDKETDNIYLRARYYDSGVGAFVNEDPIKAGLNWYSYCGGNPVMFVDPSGVDVYYYVASEFKGEAELAITMLEEKFNEPVHIIEIGEDDVYELWDKMGTNDDGDKVNISTVIINTHADASRLKGLNLDRLKGKEIDTVLLLGCNAGNLDHIYSNPMSKIINNNNTGCVIAADGSVFYKEKGRFKNKKRTRYYFESREKDSSFVDNLLPVSKNNKDRSPVGFIKYTLYDGVLYEDWLGKDFQNINSIFNKAGIYDRPSRNFS